MRNMTFAFALTLMLPALPALAATAAKPAAAPADTQTVTGGCTQRSNTSYGGLKAVPTDVKTMFVCDSAVITFADAKRQAVTVEFGLSGGKKDSKVLGLIGAMGKDGVTMKVSQMYMVKGIVNPADDGTCKLTFAGRAVTAADCSASMHQDNNRWAASVVFKAIK